MDFDKELDTSGLVCPLPLLRTKQSLANMSTGEVLKIITTDPAAIIDFKVFSEQTGNKLIYLSETTEEVIFFLKKK